MLPLNSFPLFQVKDQCTVQSFCRFGLEKVCMWLVSSVKSFSLVAFSNVKTTSSESHHRLGHLSSPILQHIISNFHLESSSPLFSNFN